MLEKDARKILLRRHRWGRYFKLKNTAWATLLQFKQTPEQQYQPHNHVINSNNIGSFTTATNNTALRWQQQQLNHIRLQIPDQKVQKNFSLKNDFEGRKREKTSPYDYAILIFRVRKKVKKGSWPPWNVPSLVSPLLLLLLVVQQVRSAANWDQRGWFKS